MLLQTTDVLQYYVSFFSNFWFYISGREHLGKMEPEMFGQLGASSTGGVEPQGEASYLPIDLRSNPHLILSVMTPNSWPIELDHGYEQLKWDSSVFWLGSATETLGQTQNSPGGITYLIRTGNALVSQEELKKHCWGEGRLSSCGTWPWIRGQIDVVTKRHLLSG